MGNTKWVHLMFAAAGLVMAYLMVMSTEWIWSYFAKPKDIYVMPIGLIAAAGTTLWAWKNERWFGRAQDIVMELMKVTWPTRKETSAATVVVIITVIIFAMFLGLFDMIWSWATGTIYG